MHSQESNLKIDPISEAAHGLVQPDPSKRITPVELPLAVLIGALSPPVQGSTSHQSRWAWLQTKPSSLHRQNAVHESALQYSVELIIKPCAEATREAWEMSRYSSFMRCRRLPGHLQLHLEWGLPQEAGRVRNMGLIWLPFERRSCKQWVFHHFLAADVMASFHAA